MNLLTNVIKDCMTGPDGKTYDPARVIGYLFGFLLVVTYIFCTVWMVVKHGSFDPQAFGLGATGVGGAILAVAGGVAVKAKTEPQQEAQP